MAELYRKSSQFRLWSFDAPTLAQMKSRNFKRSADEAYLDAHEAEQLVLFFASDKLGAICEHLNLPSQVRATSAAYFRRFFLVNSANDYDPRLLLPTCVFLAAKSENCFITADQLASSLQNIDAQRVRALEFELFSTMKFTLTVHNGLWPLQGFFLDIQRCTDTDQETLAAMFDSARKLVIECFANDVVFLYSPSRIALAALMAANEFVVTEFMAVSMDGPNRSLDTLLESVHACREKMNERSQVTMSKEELKQVNKKLKMRCSPDSSKRAKTS